MNLADLAAQAPPAEVGFEGKWHTIEFQPDLRVPQRFNIGVALSRQGKLVAFRIATDAPKLKCFYGNRFTPSAWRWVREELTCELEFFAGSALVKFESRSPQVFIGDGAYVSGSCVDSVLSRVFERVVTVVASERAPRSQGISQHDLRERVAGLLKARMSIRFDPVYQPNGLLIRDQSGVHAFDITFDDSRTASSVVSASYAQPETGQLNVMQAVSDLFTYNRIRARSQIGLAVLLPSAQMLPAESVRAWHAWWQEQSYKLRQSDLVLLAESSSPDELADQVFDWYPG